MDFMPDSRARTVNPDLFKNIRTMMSNRPRNPHLWALSLLILAAISPGSPAEPAFTYYVIGDVNDINTETNGLIVVQGGGQDIDYNFQRMGEAAGGGDFVVLRASGDDAYNEYIYALCQCDSVETIVFGDRSAAYDEFVVERIRNAEAVFIAGGDQSRYVRFWKGTPTEDAIHAVAAKPAPVGGTSAGMAILGEFSYSAMSNDSLTAEAALSDPFHADLTLETDFIRIAGLENILTDQHLIERNRIGRTVAMLARLVDDKTTRTAQAIAADRETAVHIDPKTRIATVYATSDHDMPYAYFIRTTRPASSCRPGIPLSIENVSVYRASPGSTFNLRSWSGTGGLQYSLSVSNGVLSSSRGAIY